MSDDWTQPFAGLRVADFSWVGVGPTVGKYLADFGAEVIRVESETYPETLRRAQPQVSEGPLLDRSGYYANFNSSKLGCTVNLKHPRGVEMAKRLIARSDVVTDSYTPGTMERFGLGYEELVKLRPDIVMIEMPLFGSSGPWKDFMGYGHVLQAAAGFSHFTGFPHGPPYGTGTAYTDFLVPHLATMALVAALDYRRRTGEGQYIDFGQFEAGIHGLWTANMDWAVNGNEQQRLGNRDAEAAPQGCYRCRDGKWLVISCATEEHWAALKAALGRPEWCDLDRMRRRWQRLDEQREIDRHLAFWVEDNTRKATEPELLKNENPEAPAQRRYTSFELVRYLQGFGVPAGVVQSPEDMHADPQLAHRKHYWKLQHPTMGLRTYDSPAFKLSKTPAVLRKASPCLGEDNEYVWREVVGLSEEEYYEALADAVFE